MKTTIQKLNELTDTTNSDEKITWGRMTEYNKRGREVVSYKTNQLIIDEDGNHQITIYETYENFLRVCFGNIVMVETKEWEKVATSIAIATYGKKVS